MNVTKIMTRPLKSSFFSCEKDAEEIIKRLFVTSQPYSNQLKRLLILNTKDCLDESNQNYSTIIQNTSVKELVEKQYMTLVPRINIKEHEEIKSHIILSFEDFQETSNPEYRDCIVNFEILCHAEVWNLGDYQVRPLKIAGIIDGLLNDTKLSGIGTLHFFSCDPLRLDETLLGYTLSFKATHGNDDNLPGL